MSSDVDAADEPPNKPPSCIEGAGMAGPSPSVPAPMPNCSSGTCAMRV